MERKKFIQQSSALFTTTALTSLNPLKIFDLKITKPNFTLPPLDYSYGALEPFIDTVTMEIHHDKHHKAYVDNLNAALLKINYNGESLEQIFQHVSNYNLTIRNNAGGDYNHSLFWKLIGPQNKGASPKEIESAIVIEFNSMDNFKKLFTEVALGRFGSGWVWLIKTMNNKLQIISTPNQDNPLMEDAPFKGIPIIGLDVWEHAYYLKYQNKRPEYIEAWWNVLNWDYANKLFKS